MSIDAYIELCNRYGRHIYDVQWPGWNASVKDTADVLLIKASGTYMKDVNSEMTGALVAYPSLSEFVHLRSYEPLTQTLENELVDTVKAVTLSELRPSMETAMHALIPRKYVVHTHNVYANVFTCAEEWKHVLAKHVADLGWIPIAVPGMNLAQEVAKAYPHNMPKILFLENHGIVVSDDEPDNLMQTYDELTAHVLMFLGERDIAPLPTDYTVMQWTDETTYSIDLAPGVAGSFADMTYVTGKYIYPDAAVFGQTLDLSKLQIKGNTITLTWYSQKQATNFLENVAAINYILYAHEKLGRTTKVLPQRIVAYMAEMEAEKFRKTLHTS